MWGISVLFLSLQNVNVVEQEKIDKLMLDMDGSENKCKWALCCGRHEEIKVVFAEVLFTLSETLCTANSVQCMA